ncbi:hypothetical protein AQJ30_21220, partial [Streptomyces longwoodensis]
MVAAAAATGILTLCGSSALADTQANGVAEGSPGVLAGNNVEVPVEVPVNACGNTVDPAGALNPAFANACAQAAAARHATRGSDDLGDAWGHDHHDWTHGVPRVPADAPKSEDQGGGHDASGSKDQGGGHDASGSKDQGGGHDTSAPLDQGGGGRDTSGGGESGHGSDDASTSPAPSGGHATSGGDEGYGSDDTPKGPGKGYGDSGYGSDDASKGPGKEYGDSGHDSGYGSDDTPKS